MEVDGGGAGKHMGRAIGALRAAAEGGHLGPARRLAAREIRWILEVRSLRMDGADEVDGGSTLAEAAAHLERALGALGGNDALVAGMLAQLRALPPTD